MCISVIVPDVVQFELSHGIMWHVSSMLDSRKTIMAFHKESRHGVKMYCICAINVR